MRALSLFTVALFACGETTDATDTTDDTEADTEVEDTEPADLDASGWEVHPDAPQVFSGTLVIGEQEQSGDFAESGQVRHAIVPFQGVDFRNFIGEVTGQLPAPINAPGAFELRIIVPEDTQEVGSFNCSGPGLYGVTVALVAENEQGNVVPLKVFATTRVPEDDTTKPCTMNITKNSYQRFTATISNATLLDSALVEEQTELGLKDVSVDVILREIGAAE